MRSVDNAHRAAAVVVETTYYRPTHQTNNTPAVATGVRFHGALAISLNELHPTTQVGAGAGAALGGARTSQQL